jgi:ATP-binding cassette subfamily B multidrug efflux pump
MLRWFEKFIDPFTPYRIEQPPEGLLKFYWHFVRGVWPVFAAVMVFGLAGALIEVSLFAFLGELVDMAKNVSSPREFFDKHWVVLSWMAAVALLMRPLAFALHASFMARVRWQTHRYVLRQSLSFYQNDFAGRIANRIMQTGPSMRQTVTEIVDAMWFVVIYTVSAMVLFAQADPLLMLPLMVWVIGFMLTLRHFVPRIRDLSVITSEARSTLVGRIVDSYTNILTVKLFAHTEGEDKYAREAINDQVVKLHAQLRVITSMEITMWVLNGVLIAGTTGLALWLWSRGLITVGAIAVSTGLVIRINNMAGWIMWVVTGIFENVGMVQEGAETIAKPWSVVDKPEAAELKVNGGEIRYENIKFHYGRDSGCIDHLNLTIRPGEKVGLVGRSGAGKSTLVNLLLRFHDLEGGRILIDGQDIAHVTQDSLRANIGVVTQDTSLLHRSVRDNIRYGKPDADEATVLAAAKRAHAHEFIQGLEDLSKRRGYNAHVGERGVKLSGGQRQRIAIARVLLKNAPVLVLDEATSALDSEVEAAIQEQLYNLMQGKTVIAIAHRLSTIAAMDRLIIMDKGHVVEDGTHAELIKRGGIYAQLWSRQSGGFLFDNKEVA